MSTLWIREYTNVGFAGSPAGGFGALPIAMEPGTDQTPVTFSSEAKSDAVAAGTRFVGMIADAAFHYLVGPNPTATTDMLKVPANTLIFIGVTAGDKISAVAAA